MREQEYRAALSVASLVATSSSAIAQLALQKLHCLSAIWDLAYIVQDTRGCYHDNNRGYLQVHPY